MYKLLPILLFAYGLAISTDKIYDNSYALIIGIDKYENVKHLNYAVADAESIQDILVNTFNFPEGNITLLKNEEANKQAILKAFSDLAKTAEDNDRVLIYFAGHGKTLELTEGGERGYLLPVDGNEDLYLSSIGMDELEKLSEMSRAKHMLYLVDACYGGLAAISSRGSRGLDVTSTPNYIEKITRNRGVQIITAGGKDEEVQEKAKWGASAFTLNLKRGLKDRNADMNSDGYITANELGMFLSEKVTIDSDNQQTPQYGRMTSQEGEFVFVLSEDTAVNQDKSAVVKLDLVPADKEEFKGYPLHIVFMSLGNDLTLLGVGKQLDKRSVIGLSYSKMKLEGTGYLWDLEDDYVSYSADLIHIGFGYYLRSKETSLFNPVVAGSVFSAFYKFEDQTLQLSDDINEISFSLALINYVKVFENVAIQFGIGGAFEPYFTFNENEKLYRVGYDWGYGPIFLIDITNPFSKKKN